LIAAGVLALAALSGFWREGYMDWRRGGALAIATTIAAPVGAAMARFFSPLSLWLLYLGAATVVLYLLFRPPSTGEVEASLARAVPYAIGSAALAALLGVGPGFLLVPILIGLGYATKQAAALNACAAAPASLAAFLYRAPTADLALVPTLVLVAAGSVGAFLGARLASRRLAGPTLRWIFASVVVVLTFHQIVRLIDL
jgi:uncharacterized membrane protein YfcA